MKITIHIIAPRAAGKSYMARALCGAVANTCLMPVDLMITSQHPVHGDMEVEFNGRIKPAPKVWP